MKIYKTLYLRKHTRFETTSELYHREYEDIDKW